MHGTRVKSGDSNIGTRSRRNMQDVNGHSGCYDGYDGPMAISIVNASIFSSKRC